MASRLGDGSLWGENPWEQGTITTGAWREDEEDPVYKLSRSNPPSISGTIANIGYYFSAATGIGFNRHNDGYISSTHFWYADNGDEIATDHYGALNLTPFGIHTYQFTVPNAYQKIRKYADGGWDIRIPMIIRNVKNGNGVLCFTTRAYVSLRYYSLPNTFKHRIFYLSKVEWPNGEVTNYPSLPTFLEVFYTSLNPIPYEQLKENIIWEILGRMCHLLQDVGSPAHANIDDHGGTGLIYDGLESSFGELGWNAQTVADSFGTQLLDPYVCSDPIHFLMYTTQQQANHFATNGPHLKGFNDIFGGNHFPIEISYLNSLNVENYGLPLTMMETIPPEQILNMRDRLIPQIIRATSSLLYWFAVEAEILEYGTTY